MYSIVFKLSRTFAVVKRREEKFCVDFAWEPANKKRGWREGEKESTEASEVKINLFH